MAFFYETRIKFGTNDIFDYTIEVNHHNITKNTPINVDYRSFIFYPLYKSKSQRFNTIVIRIITYPYNCFFYVQCKPC